MKLLFTIAALMSTLFSLAVSSTIPAAMAKGIFTRDLPLHPPMLDVTTLTALAQVFGNQLAGSQNTSADLSAICSLEGPFEAANKRWGNLGFSTVYINRTDAGDAARIKISKSNADIFLHQLQKSFLVSDWPYLCTHLSFSRLDAFSKLLNPDDIINGMCGDNPQPRPATTPAKDNPRATDYAGQLYGYILAAGAAEKATLNEWCSIAKDDAHAKAMAAINLDPASVQFPLCGLIDVYTPDQAKEAITVTATGIFAMILTNASDDPKWAEWLEDHFLENGANEVGLYGSTVTERICDLV